MATFTGLHQGVSQYQTKLVVWQKSQSINNNTTTVGWELYLRKTTSTASTGYWSNNKSSWSVSIGGKTTSGEFGSYDFRGTAYYDKYISGGTFTISHDSAGNANFWCTASINASGALGLGGASGNFRPDTIPRYATLTGLGYEPRSATTVNVSWSTDRGVNNIQYRVNNSGSWITIKQSTVEGRTFGTFDVTGLATNKSSVINVCAQEPRSGLWHYRDVTVRPYDLITASAQTFNLKYGNTANSTLTIKRASTNITANAGLYYTGGSTYIKGWTGTTGGGMGLTASEVNNAISRSPNSAKTNFYLVIDTMYKGKKEGTTTYTIPAVISPVGISPTIGSITYKDNMAEAQQFLMDDQTIAKVGSSPAYTIAGMSSKQSATLKTVSISDSAGTQTASISGSTNISKVIQGGFSTAKEKSTVTATVTDSRGFTGTMSIPVNTIDYYGPSITNPSAYRKNGSSQESYFKAVVKMPTLITKNGDVQNVKMAYRYRENTNDSNWSAINFITVPNKSVSGTTITYKVDFYIRQFDTDKSYLVEFMVSDAHALTKPDMWQFASKHTATLDKAISLLRFEERKLSSSVDFHTQRRLYQQGNRVVDDFNSQPARRTTQNFNDCWRAGVWQYTSSWSANSAPNSPKLEAGRLEVYGNSDTNNPNISSTSPWLHVTQRFISISGQEAFRTYSTDGNGKGTWTAWRHVMTSAEVGDWVVEQGGTYTKWNSGKMECWGQASATVAIDVAYGSGFYNGARPNIKFPVAFTSTPTIQATPVDNFAASTVPWELSTSGFNVVYWYAFSKAPSARRTFHWRAVGRWK